MKKRKKQCVHRILLISINVLVYFCGNLKKSVMSESNFEKMHEEFHNRASREIRNVKILMGSMIVIFGVLLLVKNLGLMPEPYKYLLETYLVSWQSLCIFIGIFVLIKDRFMSLSGVMLMVIGVFFIARKECAGLDYDDLFNYWPVLVILFGLSVIFKHKHRCNDVCNTNSVSLTKDYLDDIRVFSGGKTSVESKNFKGGKCVAVFGGTEINCSEAVLADGVNVIEVFAMIGGFTIIVPNGWNVKVDVVAMLGGINDKRSVHSEPIDSKKTLVIKGVAILGGGEIRSVK